MTEQELRERLNADLELPAIVENRMEAAYVQVREKGGHTMKKKSVRRSVRTLVVLAAVIAALGIGATGIYMVTRAEVALPTTKPAMEGLFGNESRPSTSGQTWYYKEKDTIVNLPDEERVPVDDQAAVALLNGYLPEVAYAWQLGEYTFTVESYLLDEGSGTGKIYYTLERAGGLENVFTFQPDGEIWYNNGEVLDLRIMNAFDNSYADESRTTEEKLCVAASFAYCNFKQKDVSAMKAEDGVSFEFVSKDGDGVKSTDILTLPGLKSLPNEMAYNAVGEVKAIFSAIGIKLVHIELAEGETDTREVTLQYADGTEYVVKSDANNIKNYDYALGSAHAGESFQLCFNRLVDPSRVVSVTVDGHVYAVK